MYTTLPLWQAWPFRVFKQRIHRGGKLSWNWFHVWLICIIRLSVPDIMKISLQIYYHSIHNYIMFDLLCNKRRKWYNIFLIWKKVLHVISWMMLTISIQYSNISTCCAINICLWCACNMQTRMWHPFKDCRETFNCIIPILLFKSKKHQLHKRV